MRIAGILPCMRTLVVGLLALVSCVALLIAGPGVAAETKSARLILVKKEPLVLRGVGFRALQPVTVTVVVDGREKIRRTQTKRTGAFTLTFVQLAGDPCTLEARAVSRGRVATYKAPQRMCPMRLDPPRP